MKKLFTLLALCCATIILHAQSVGINTVPAASAALDVSSTTKGMLVPRMTTAQRNAIVSPATSLMIFQTDGTAGFYYFTGTTWSAVAAPSTTALPNFFVGHNTVNSNPAVFISPYVTNATNSPVSITSFLIPANTTFTINFYSYENEGLTFELFGVAPVATSPTYSVSGSVLATCATAAWSSGAPITSSFTYNATAGQLLTVKVNKTGGGNFIDNGGFYTAFSAN